MANHGASGILQEISAVLARLLHNASKSGYQARYFSEAVTKIVRELDELDRNTRIPDTARRPTGGTSPADSKQPPATDRKTAAADRLTRLLALKGPPQRAHALSCMDPVTLPLAGLTKPQWTKLRKRMTPEWAEGLKKYISRELAHDIDKHQSFIGTDLDAIQKEMDALEKKIKDQRSELDEQWESLFGTNRETALDKARASGEQRNSLALLQHLESECGSGEAKDRLTELVTTYEEFLDATKVPQFMPRSDGKS